MRHLFLIRATRVLSALLVAVSCVMVTGGTASASNNVPGNPGSSCAGSLVHKPFTKNTSKGSVKIYVYYSSANGGTNCIIARKSGAWTGKKTFMNLSIWRDDTRALGEYPYTAYDSGAYTSYAGSISIPHTNGRCISASLDLGSGKSAATQFAYWHEFSFACG